MLFGEDTQTKGISKYDISEEAIPVTHFQYTFYFATYTNLRKIVKIIIKVNIFL